MGDDPVNVNEFQELARRALPKMYYDYYRGGAEDEFSLRENIEAFQRITLRPRILVDVGHVNMSTTILGFQTSSPGMHKLVHSQGEVATARAAAACNTIMVLSFSSNCTIEEVADSCDAVRFFQLYVVKAVAGAVPVLFDGGVRRGTDVFKALALGAKVVMFGRPAVFGLAAKGEQGVRRVVQMLKEELELSMALAGCPTIAHITRNHVQTQHDRFRSMI